MSKQSDGCEKCNKTTLSFLLTRPSPIAKDARLKPQYWVDQVQSDEKLMAGLLPEGITESRFCLRFLRPGYVMVHIPGAPKPLKEWLVYRVTNDGDILPETHELFATEQDVACKRQGHNTMGLKLLTIPHAHLLFEAKTEKNQPKGFWIAFSATLWDERARTVCKANPQGMQFVALTGGSPNTFKPTVENLRRLVLECSVPDLNIDQQKSQDFKFNKCNGQEASLSNNLTSAAANHPRTKGLEQAIVLSDIIGITAELNGLRQRRHDLAQEFPHTLENKQAFNVNKLIQTFKGNLIADAAQDAMEAVSPLMTEKQFKLIMEDAGERRVRGWPEGTRWEPLPKELEETYARKARYQQNVGSVVFPDHDERAYKFAKQQGERTWSRMLDHYDENARQAWRKDFLDRFKKEHVDSLLKHEQDWDRALKCDKLHSYFWLHFNEKAPDSPEHYAKTGCSSGIKYCEETKLAYTPVPYCEAILPTFVKQLQAEFSDPGAHMKRALLGNQSTLWENLLVNPGEGDGKRDKTYDIVKGLIGEAKGILEAIEEKKQAEREAEYKKQYRKDNPGLSRHQKKNPPPLPATPEVQGMKLPPGQARRFAFLTDSTLGLSGGIVAALAATATKSLEHYIASQPKELKKILQTMDPAILQMLDESKRMALIHSLCEDALRLSMKGGAINLRVLVDFWIDPEMAVQIKQGRGEPVSKRVNQGWRSKNDLIKMSVLLDVDTLAQMQLESGTPLAYQIGVRAREITLGPAAEKLKQSRVPEAVAGDLIMLNPERLLKVCQEHQERAKKMPSLMKSIMDDMIKHAQNSNSLQILKRNFSSVDYRLAMGSMIVQSIGLLEGITNWWAADLEKIESKKEAAFWGMMDSVAGLMGGMAEMMHVAYNAKLLAQGGEAALGRSMGLPFLRAVGYGAGVVGNVINAYVAFEEAKNLKEKGEFGVATLLNRAGFFLAAGSIPLTLLMIQSFGEMLAARGLLSGMALRGLQRLALTMAVRSGAMGFISIPGVGYAFTAVGVGTVIYAVITTPTPFQGWLKNCHFGKPDTPLSRRTSWEAEEEALKKLEQEMKEAAQIEKTRDELGNEQSPSKSPKSDPIRRVKDIPLHDKTVEE